MHEKDLQILFEILNLSLELEGSGCILRPLRAAWATWGVVSFTRLGINEILHVLDPIPNRKVIVIVVIAEIGALCRGVFSTC